MEITTILIALLALAILLALAFIVLAIIDRKKHKFTFLKSQLILIMIAVLVVGVISVNAKPIEYSDAGKMQEVKMIDTLEDQYKVTLKNGNTVYTKNLIYGEEYGYISNCTIKSRTVLGFCVTSTDSLLIVQPDVSGFKDMSKSQKLSIIKRYNNERLQYSKEKMNSNGK